MKISELIAELLETLREDGDLEVVCYPKVENELSNEGSDSAESLIVMRNGFGKKEVLISNGYDEEYNYLSKSVKK